MKWYSKGMSLYMKQNETRSELQKRVAAELQEKAKKKALEAERPDGVDDSAFVKDTKATTSLAWAWILIGIAIIAIAIWLVIATM